MLHRTFSSLFVLCILLTQQSCKPGNSTGSPGKRSVIIEPLQDVKIACTNYIANTTGDTLVLSGGSKLFIPRDAFETMTGQLVQGEVELQYRPFYSTAEIIASGITMKYDSAEKEFDFISAGMFELSGTQNGQPIRIRKDKTLELCFASSRNDESYNFYRLDTSNGQWSFLSTTSADSVSKSIPSFNSILAENALRPVEPQRYDDKQPVIDIDIDPELRPELSFYNGIIWQYAGTGKNPEQNKWIYDAEWSSIDLKAQQQTGAYTLTLSDKNQSFTTEVRPVFRGKDYDNAMRKFQQQLTAFKEEQQRSQEAREAIGKWQNQPLNYTRNLRVSAFGYYNCDRIRNRPDQVSLAADFRYNDAEFGRSQEAVSIYLINGVDPIGVNFSGQSGSQIRFVPTEKNGLIALDRSTGKVAILTAKDFQKQTQSGVSGVQLHFQVQSKRVHNLEELDAICDLL